jgi:hypothetical protein
MVFFLLLLMILRIALRSRELLLLLVSSLRRLWIACLEVVGSLQRLRYGRSSISTIERVCFV